MSTTDTEASRASSRTQFTLRDLLMQVALLSAIFALLATRSMIFVACTPTVVVATILVATRGAAISGVIVGFVSGVLVFVAAGAAELRYAELGLWQLLAVFLLGGSLGATLCGSVQAAVIGFRGVGMYALVLLVLLLAALLILVSDVTIIDPGPQILPDTEPR